MEATELEGQWRLASWVWVAPAEAAPTGTVPVAGSAPTPFGPGQTGVLALSAGRFACQAGAGGRRPLQRNSSGIVHGERGLAFMSYLAFAGTWTLQGDRLTCRVDASLIPDWVGASIVQQVHLDGDTLTLAFTLDASSTLEGAHTAVWERLEPGEAIAG